MAEQDRDEIADALASLASGHDPAGEEVDESRAEAHPAAAMRSSRPALPSDILPPVAQTAPDPDDEVIAPPADPSVLGRLRGSPHRAHKGFGLEARRTIIPILLTCGVLLIVSGTLRYIAGPDSPFAALPLGMVIAAFVLGVALLGSAIPLMISVRQELASRDTSSRRR